MVEYEIMGKNAQVFAWLSSSVQSSWKKIPYVIRSGNLWVIGDNPLSTVHERDRYLVFADLLHDILGEPHEEDHRALVRVEDVHPLRNPRTLREIADFLSEQNIPFTVAVIPIYREKKKGGWTELRMSERKDFLAALRYMEGKGGSLLMHGLTHQNDVFLQVERGVTAVDYEFFNAEDIHPLPNEEPEEIVSRIREGQEEFRKAGLTPLGWETPHYSASPLAYYIFGREWQLTVQRLLLTERAHGMVAEQQQFFPYIIERDIFGQRIMPENLGYIKHLPTGGFSIDEIISNAQANLVVRDGWATFYWHPFYWEEGIKKPLQEVIYELQRMGYRFVDLRDFYSTLPGP